MKGIIDMAIDNELLKGIHLMKDGDEAGFNMVYSKTYNFVYAKAKFIMKNEQDALDLTQETYVQAYKGITSLEDTSNIYAWLGTIVYNQGMRIFRKKKEILLDEGAEGIFDEVVSNDSDTIPEESMEAKATVDIVKGFIEELPELQKMAVLAFYYDNMKIDDIATICECSPNTIKSRLNYAKKFLKDKVEEHEKQNNYKLHTFTPALFILVLKTLLNSDKYNISAHVAESIYGGVCSTTGATVAVNTGTAVATKVSLSIGAKIAISLTSLTLVAGSAAGIIIAVNNGSDTSPDPITQTQPTTSIIVEDITEVPTVEETTPTQEETTPTNEETTDNDSAKENIWNLTEGNYLHTYTKEGDNAKILTRIYIGNLRYDTPDGSITADITMDFLRQHPGSDYMLVDVIILEDVVFENGHLNITAPSYEFNSKTWMMKLQLLRTGSILFSAEVDEGNGKVYTYNADCPTHTILVKETDNTINDEAKFQTGTYTACASNAAFPEYKYDFTISINNLTTDETSGYQTFDLDFVSSNTVYTNDTELFSIKNVQYKHNIIVFNIVTSKNVVLYGYMYPTKSGNIVFGFDVPIRTLGNDTLAYYTTHSFAPYYTGTAILTPSTN